MSEGLATDTFRFEDPAYLWLLLLLPVLAYLKGARGQEAAVRFSGLALVHRVRRGIRSRAGHVLLSLRLLALALLVIALARPQFGTGSTEYEASGIDIILAVDLSGSMWAHDFEVEGRPTDRLTAVKAVMEDFIRKRPNDRIGITAFASEAYTVSPLTLNHGWLLENNLRRLRIGLIDKNSTAIGSAIGVSANRLTSETSKDAVSRIIILLTDGSNNAGQLQPVTAAEAAAALGIKIYTIGAGKEGLVPIPYFDRADNPVRDRRGNIRLRPRQRSAIDLETLKEIAGTTGAKFYHATDTETLVQIYDEIDRLERTEVKIIQRTLYDDIFFWPALAGFILVALEQLLAQTRLRTLP